MPCVRAGEAKQRDFRPLVWGQMKHDESPVVARLSSVAHAVGHGGSWWLMAAHGGSRVFTVVHVNGDDDVAMMMGMMMMMIMMTT